MGTPTTRKPIMVIALGLALLYLGCCPTYSPPIRSTHYGAPGRVGPKEGEVMGGMTHQLTGGGHVGMPVAPNLRLELGADGAGKWAMGSFGIRRTFGGRPKTNRRGLSADVAAGIGLGLGGENHDNEDCEDSQGPWNRAVYGGYVGAGAGWHILDWLALFGRGRAQMSKASGTPLTLWYSGMGGPEFRIGPVSLYAAAGVAGYVNRVDDEFGWLVEGGLAVHFRVLD